MIGKHYCMWQFNFREFNLKEDMYAQDSIELLKHSGIDFQANEERGIDVQRFGELLMVSGVVLSEKVRHNLHGTACRPLAPNLLIGKNRNELPSGKEILTTRSSAGEVAYVS